MKLIKRSATLQQEKDNLRKKIKTLKGQYSQQDLIFRSQEVLAILEITGVFQEAKHIFIYNGL